VRVFDEVRTVCAICGCNPTSLLVSTIVTFPFDIVKKWHSTMFIELGVQDGFVLEVNSGGRLESNVRSWVGEGQQVIGGG